MKSRLLVLLILYVLAAPVIAQGVFVCVQANGTREYRNNGDMRGCRKLDLETISTIPAPAANQQAKAAAIDPSFPRIDGQIQKRRRVQPEDFRRPGPRSKEDIAKFGEVISADILGYVSHYLFSKP